MLFLCFPGRPREVPPDSRLPGGAALHQPGPSGPGHRAVQHRPRRPVQRALDPGGDGGEDDCHGRGTNWEVTSFQSESLRTCSTLLQSLTAEGLEKITHKI